MELALRLQAGGLRYSRAEVCATVEARGRFNVTLCVNLVSGGFAPRPFPKREKHARVFKNTTIASRPSSTIA